MRGLPGWSFVDAPLGPGREGCPGLVMWLRSPGDIQSAMEVPCLHSGIYAQPGTMTNFTFSTSLFFGSENGNFSRKYREKYTNRAGDINEENTSILNYN